MPPLASSCCSIAIRSLATKCYPPQRVGPLAPAQGNAVRIGWAPIALEGRSSRSIWSAWAPKMDLSRFSTMRKQDSVLSSTRWPASSLQCSCIVSAVLSTAESSVLAVVVCSCVPRFWSFDSSSPQLRVHGEPFRNANALLATQAAFSLCPEDFDQLQQIPESGDSAWVVG